MEVWKNILSAVPISVLVLLPGVVWLRCEGKFAVAAKSDAMERGLSYLLYSVISYALVYFVFATEVENLFGSKAFTLSIMLKLAIALLLVGMIGGVLTGLNRYYDIVGTMLRKMGVAAVHPVETGWVCAFNRKRGCLVRLTFTNGVERYGMFGTKSLASCGIGDGEDLFLEYTFRETEAGELTPEEGSTGIWVAKQELTCVRFYDHLELESDDVKAIAKKREIFDWFRGITTDASQESIGSSTDRGKKDRGKGSSPKNKPAEALGDDRESVESVKIRTPSSREDIVPSTVLQIMG